MSKQNVVFMRNGVSFNLIKEGQAYGYLGGSKGGINWEIGIDIYTLLYIK